MKSVSIGSGIRSIGEGAFACCPELTDFYCLAESIPTIDDWNEIDIFEESYIEYATLHVPAVSIEAYRATEPWSRFKSVVAIESNLDVIVTLNKSEAILEKGKTMTLKAAVYPTTEDQSVTWKSSNTAVATVSSKGKVKGVKAGIVTITCTSVATGAKATCKVTVGYVKLDKTEAILENGETMTLTPTVYPSKLTDRSVTWKSSDETIAKVTSSGEVTGVNAGTAVITCTSVATGLSTTCTVTIVSSVTLNKTEAILKKGKTMTLKATISPEIEDKSVTWKSSDETVATVSSDGKVKGIAAGTATITCTSVAIGLSTTCKVTVTEFTPARTMLGGVEEVTGIETVEETPAAEEPFDVYDLKGHRVLHQVTSLDALPAGVYIVNGKKVLKK